LTASGRWDYDTGARRPDGRLSGRKAPGGEESPGSTENTVPANGRRGATPGTVATESQPPAGASHRHGVGRHGGWSGPWNAGVLTSCSLLPGAKQKGVFSFVQISDSHIGFNKEPNQNVTKTFQEAIKPNQCP